MRRISLCVARFFPSKFDDEFFSCVCCILPVSKREPAIDRLIEFVVQFATSYSGETETDDDFVQNLVSRLLDFTVSKNKSARLRATQLVGRVFNSMSEDAEVSDELFDAVETRMIARCRDKVPSVRAFGVRALFRLQDPTSATDEITQELLRLMSDDVSKEVRMAAVSTIAPSKHAIEAIVARTRDIAVEVRVHALKVLRDKVEMRWLSISQRSSLLSSSLNDRDARVVSVSREMLLSAWLHKGSENDVLKLLKALDVVSHEAAAQHAMSVLLNDNLCHQLVLSAGKKWQVEGQDQLEAIFCFRALLDALSENVSKGVLSASNELEEVTPELHVFCDGLKGVLAWCDEAAGSPNAVRANFALAQLLSAGTKLDMSDEHGRGQIEQLLSKLVKSLSTPYAMLPGLFKALQAAHPADPSSFQRLVLELISEIEDPLELEDADSMTATQQRQVDAEKRLQREQRMMLAQARWGELVGEIKCAVNEEDYEKASSLKSEAAELKAELKELSVAESEHVDSAQRTVRGLQLASLLLCSHSLCLAEHELSELPARFLPLVQSPSAEHRALAIKFFPVFITSVLHDQEAVQIAALKAVFDLLLVHSPAAFFSPRPDTSASSPLSPQEDGCSREIADLLVPLLAESGGHLRRIAVHGVCKLMHVDALRSTSLCARLLLIYFQADTFNASEEAAALRQILTLFFMAGSHPSALCAALLPALRVSLAASPGSLDAGVDLDSLINFVIAMSKPSVANEQSRVEWCLHEQLALALVCEAALAPDEEEGRLLPKAVLQLSLHTASASTLAVLACLLRKIEAKLVDKKDLKYLSKAIDFIHALRSDATKDSSDADEDEALALADQALEAQRSLRECDELALNRGSEHVRDDESTAAEPTVSPKKHRRKLAKVKGTPRHLGHTNENVVANLVEAP